MTLDDINLRLKGNRTYSIPHIRNLISDVVKLITPIVQEKESMSELGWRWEALDIVRQLENFGTADNVARMQSLRLLVSHVPPAELKQLVGTMSTNAQYTSELWQTLKSKIPG